MESAGDRPLKQPQRFRRRETAGKIFESYETESGEYQSADAGSSADVTHGRTQITIVPAALPEAAGFENRGNTLKILRIVSGFHARFGIPADLSVFAGGYCAEMPVCCDQNQTGETGLPGSRLE